MSLEITSESEEERKVRNTFKKENEPVIIAVKEIAMGSNHMLVIGRDSDSKETPPLEYADDILKKLRDYFLKKGKEKFLEDYPYIDEDEIYDTDTALIENTIKDEFKEDFKDKDQEKFPHAKVSTFLELLLKVVGDSYDN